MQSSIHSITDELEVNMRCRLISIIMLRLHTLCFEQSALTFFVNTTNIYDSFGVFVYDTGSYSGRGSNMSAAFH